MMTCSVSKFTVNDLIPSKKHINIIRNTVLYTAAHQKFCFVVVHNKTDVYGGHGASWPAKRLLGKSSMNEVANNCL